jgi:soluble lytic murein transglycosylase-like protein
MRGFVIAAAVIALTQPALAAKSHKTHSHRHYVSHLSHHHHAMKDHHVRARLRRAPIETAYAMRQPSVPTNAIDKPVFVDPSVPNLPRQQTWAIPAAPRAVASGEPARRMRNARVRDGALDAMISRHAAANGLPVELVHRVVTRESGYNSRARNGSNLGLMQIKHATARGVGYTGSASGLMDPETNLTYAVRYLAGAYRAAGGNSSRAVALYASGYHGRGVPRATRIAVAPRQAQTWQAQTTPGQW